MKWLRNAVIVFVLLIFAVPAVWWWNFPHATVRYRITLNAVVDGNARASSSVWEGAYDSPACLDGCGLVSSDYKGLPVSLKIDNETYIVLTQGRRKFAVPYLGIFSETAPSYLPLMALGFSYLNRTNAQFVRGMAFLSGKGIIPTEMLTPICVGPINSTDCSDYNHSSEQTLHGHSVTIQAATLEML